MTFPYPNKTRVRIRRNSLRNWWTCSSPLPDSIKGVLDDKVEKVHVKISCRTLNELTLSTFQYQVVNELMVSFPSPFPEFRVAAGFLGVMTNGTFTYPTKD